VIRQCQVTGISQVSAADTVLTPPLAYNRCRSETPPGEKAEMSGATIEVAGLRKRFGSTQAIDGMTFSVPPGRVTGFVGQMGRASQPPSG
jgi:ABC-type glutathione transport system ATPase component